jgi:hypothetical protein
MFVRIRQRTCISAVDRGAAPITSSLENEDTFARACKLPCDGSAARARPNDYVLVIQGENWITTL